MMVGNNFFSFDENKYIYARMYLYGCVCLNACVIL